MTVVATDGPAGIDLTLAALAGQTCGQELLDVAVVVDASGASDLPARRPERVRVVTAEAGRGRAAALHAGVAATDGEILVWLDAGDVPAPGALEEVARWHDRIDDAVTLRTTSYLGERDLRPEDLLEPDAAGLDPLLAATDVARDAAAKPEPDDEPSFADVTLTSVSTLRDLYLRAGGLDPVLPHGGERDLIYRLAARGAVLVPAPLAVVVRAGEAPLDSSLRAADPFDAQRVPLDGDRLRSVGGVWQVPLVHAVVRCDEKSVRFARACVERLLASRRTDLHVTLVVPWSDGPRGMPDGLEAVLEWFRADPRVTIAADAPDDVFPAAFRLDVPVVAGLGPDSLGDILDVAVSRHAGLVRVPAPGGDVALLRTAADARARRHLPDVDNLQERIDAVWGVWWARIDGIVDLTTVDDLDAPVLLDDATDRVAPVASTEPPATAAPAGAPAAAAAQAPLPRGFRAPLGLVRDGLRGLVRELARRLGRGSRR